MIKTKKKSKKQTIPQLKKTTNQKILITFLQMLNTIKIYHWSTLSYAKHKATDELYASLNDNIDSFVEKLLLDTRIELPTYSVKRSTNFNNDIKMYVRFLEHLGKYIDESRTDLLNIRDEILGNINQYIYLSKLK